MSVNSVHLSPCLLLPSPSIPHELVLEYEIWVLCIFMIKADDILMGGTKKLHLIGSCQREIPLHLWDLPFSLPILGGRTWRLSPLSNQTMQKWNYQILFIAAKFTWKLVDTNKLETFVQSPHTISIRQNLASKHSHSVFHDRFNISPMESRHNVDKTKFNGLTILEKLALAIENMNSAFYSLEHIQGIVILGEMARRLQAMCWGSYVLSDLEKINF